ncbi:MAG: hypothetical protein D6744_17470 [Planctomycetota bacterium]|nr:MAG: hypothetical protein D6744_17470 [Planctomycetota bacterium]
MVSRFGAQVALLAFAAAILAGLAAGNAPMTVLTRALLVLAGAVFIGQFVGWTSRLVLRDYLQSIKRTIDLAHAAAVDAHSPQQGRRPDTETAESVE